MTGDTFEASVSDMMQTLYRVTCSQLSVEADREDAVQEALRRAWEKKDSLINESYFRTWIIRILLNACHDIQREKQRKIPTPSVPEPPPGPADPSIDLKECLLRLEERERIPILLYYLEGYDVREIASILRIPQGTVKSRLKRGRGQLKSICREEVFEE